MLLTQLPRKLAFSGTQVQCRIQKLILFKRLGQGGVYERLFQVTLFFHTKMAQRSCFQHTVITPPPPA